MSGDVWVYAHRGASAELPENTLRAFERALALGVDALETDVHLTRDGVVVVHHDADGGRTCGVPTRLSAATASDVASWDAGFGWVLPGGARPFAGRGYRVPTLEEVIARFPGIPLNVDLKVHDPAAARRVVDVVMAAGAAATVRLTSASDRALAAIRAAGYAGPTGIGRREAIRIIASPLALLRRRPPLGGALQIPVRFRGMGLLSRALVARCHALGIRVDYWTVNAPGLARRIVALGADGVMTDDPRRVVPTVRAAAASRTT